MRVFLPRLILFLVVLLNCGRGAENPSPAARLPSGPVLYFFAHQDDEVFVLGKMRREVLAGREVHVLWITDGARDGNAVHREKESRAVMELVGLPAARLHFLRFPDHASFHHLEMIYDQITPIVQARPFAEIDSPAYEGGNIDHDVAALMAALAVRLHSPAPVHLEFPLYNRYQNHQRYGVFLPNSDTPDHVEKLDPERRALVLEALKLYHSQRVLLTVLAIVGHKKTMLDHGEPWRFAPTYNFLRRPMEEACGYEVSGLHRAKFADWLREVDPFLRAHSARSD